MPKTYLHLVRHAQGYHNLNTASHSLPDPDLTPLGKTQCQTLSQAFPYSSQITHLVASPLRRTLYTALLSFPTAIQAGHKLLAIPELQETSDLPCDTGSAVSALKQEFGTNPSVDLSLVEEGWNSKVGKYEPSAPAISARAREARIFLRSLAAQASSDKDNHIVVVTHGGYLHYFTEDWDEHEKFCGTGWANTEFRSYEFAGGKEDEGASLRETAESKKRRRGSEIPLTGDEKRELESVGDDGRGAAHQTNGEVNGEEKTRL